ncbi:MAG: serine/threonine protein kinase [Eggerthellaceae bacterium]|jgi:serine/threonine protein kinase
MDTKESLNNRSYEPVGQASHENDLAYELAQVARGAAYHTERLLKEGEQSRTELVRNENGDRFIRKYFADDAGFGNQYEALQNLEWPGIPHIVDAYHAGGHYVVVSEYIEGQTLLEYVQAHGPCDEVFALGVLQSLTRTLEILHGLSPAPLIHRDIKPSNIILSSRGVVLIDFGIARRVNPEALKDTHCWGTQGYAAPEQFGFGQSDERTDLYALGMVFYFMLSGKDPEPSLQKNLDTMRLPGHAAKIIRVCSALDAEERLPHVSELNNLMDEEYAYIQKNRPPSPPQVEHLPPQGDLQINASEKPNPQNQVAVSGTTASKRSARKKERQKNFLRRKIDENDWMPKSPMLAKFFVGWHYLLDVFTLCAFVLTALCCVLTPFYYSDWVFRDIQFFATFFIFYLPWFIALTNAGNVISKMPPHHGRWRKILLIALILLFTVSLFYWVIGATAPFIAG